MPAAAQQKPVSGSADIVASPAEVPPPNGEVTVPEAPAESSPTTPTGIPPGGGLTIEAAPSSEPSAVTPPPESKPAAGPVHNSAASHALVDEGYAAPVSVGTPPASPATAEHAKVKSVSRESSRKRAVGNPPEATASGSAPEKDNSPFAGLEFSSNHGPINIQSDSLSLDYKSNSVMFRGHVRALQAGSELQSETLEVKYGKDFHEVQELIANNNVRMSRGTQWATSDHAVLNEQNHTVVLTGSPVVHDGNDQITGSRITVYLQSGKSVVEGAKAVIFPRPSKNRDNEASADRVEDGQ
jgi:lipopolysaccharide export system protein LptA